MQGQRLAGVGVAIAGGGYLTFVLLVGFRYGFNLYASEWSALLVVPGLLLAAAGVAGLPGVRARGLAALGFTWAGLAQAGLLLSDLGSIDVAGHLLGAIGFFQASWVAALWWNEPAGPGPKRIAGLRLSIVACAASTLWYITTTIFGSGFPILAAPLIAFAGFALAWRGLRAAEA